MSSSEWYQIRSASDDASNLRYTELLNKININTFSSTASEDIKRPKIIADTTNSTVGYQDPFYIGKKHTLTLRHQLPTEPNADRMKMWLRFAYIDDRIQDLAKMENHAYLEGYPILCPGYDDGVISMFLASKFNSIPEQLDYAHVPMSNSINIANFSTGFSFTVMFKPLSFVQHGGRSQHVLEILAEPDADEWACLRYSEDRELHWFVRDEGTTYDVITEPNTLLTKSFYMATVTYDPLASPRQKVLLNGFDIADVDTRTPAFPTGEDNSLHLGISCRRDVGACNMILQDVRLHKGAMTLLEHQNLWANMRSIDPILFGEFAVPGYWWITPPADEEDFDEDDFDEDDFLT